VNVNDLYDSFDEFKTIFLNSAYYQHTLDEKRNEELEEIKELLDNKSDEPEKAGASVNGIFSSINNLFKKEMSEMFNSFNNFFKDITSIEDAPTLEFTNFVRDLMNALTLDGTYDSPEELALLYREVGIGIHNIGVSISPLSKGLYLFAVADKLGATKGFVRFMNSLVTSKFVKDLGDGKIENVGIGLQELGKGIFDYSKYVSLSAPLLLIAAPASYLARPVISNMLRALMVVNGKGEDVHNASKALSEVGKSMIIMSGSLGILSIMPMPDVSKVALVVGTMGTIMGGFVLISKYGGVKGKYMKDAAISMGIMSASVGLFGLSIRAFEDVKPSDMIKAGLSITTLTLLTKYLASNKVDVIFAPIAMGLMVAATYGLAKTMLVFHDVEWEDMAKAGVAIGALTLLAGVIGTPELIVPMALGAAVIAGVSLSLAYSIKMINDSFTNLIKSLKYFKNSGWTEDDNELLKSTFSAILGSVTSTMTDGGAWQTVKNIYGGLAGAGMLGIISSVLNDLVRGIAMYKDANITPEMATDVGKGIGGLINGLKDAVTEIGKSEGFFTDSNFENGIEAISGLGKVIGDIANGVFMMSKNKFVDSKGVLRTLNKDDYKNAGDNIAALITAITDPITKLGTTSSSSHQLFGMSFTLFGEPDFENGIESLAGFGSLVSTLADSVIKMSTYTFIDPISNEKVVLSEKHFENAGKSISALITTITKSFTDIGSTEGLIMDNDFKNGLDSFDDFDEVVKRIVNSVAYMAGAVYYDSIDGEYKRMEDGDYINAGNNIKSMIGAVKNAFTQIGNMEHWYTDGAFLKGKSALSGVGGIMTQLGQSVDFIINKMKMDEVMAEHKIKKVLEFIKMPFDTVLEIEDFDDTIAKLSSYINVSTGSINSMGTSIQNILGYSDGVDLDDYIRRVTLYDSMTYNLLKLADKSDDVVKFTKGIVNMNNSNVKFFHAINDGTRANLEYTIKLFESLSKMNDIEYTMFDEKIKRVEDLITKTKDISDNTGMLNFVMNPKDKHDTTDALLEGLLNTQEEIINALNEITTTLRGRLLVEIDE